MKQYTDLVNEVLNNGTRKENRTGIDTISTFNYNYEIDLSKGFPLLTSKEISWKNIVIENLWFLSGSTDINLLRKHNCKFWDAWAEPGTNKVPSAYGNFWRNYPIHKNDQNLIDYNDQVKWVLEELKRNPMSRRMVVLAWAPGNAQTSKLPPCHVMWVLNVQNDENGEPRLNLHLTQRSCDVALGVPYNIAGYSFLLQLFAHLSGIKVGVFAHTLIDAHIYTSKADGSQAEYDHVPGLKEQIKREYRNLPVFKIDENIKDLDDIIQLLNADTSNIMEAFKLTGYDPHPFIPFKVAV